MKDVHDARVLLDHRSAVRQDEVMTDTPNAITPKAAKAIIAEDHPPPGPTGLPA